MDELAAAQQRVQALADRLAQRGPVKRIETHASWVLLAGDEAWKLKKPLDLGFLDYSTLEKRRHACEEELRLNRRTAPELYLGVEPVTASSEQPRFGGDGPPLDHAVHMRRFPDGQLFAEQLDKGALRGELMDALARHVADFHQRAEVAPIGGDFGTPEAVIKPVQENFAPIREGVSAPEVQARLERVERWSGARSEALRQVFRQRLRQGRVRECHGDLHLRNIVLLEGVPRLFDGIEFNPELRWTDVMADAGFLVMDLQARGQAGLAHRFINAYLEWSGDYDGLRVLPYYVVYRAMVRAKVAAIRMQQAEGSTSARECADDLHRYLALAEQGMREGEPCMAIMSGVSGAGKSRHSRVLVDKRGFIRLRSDVERKRLAGLAPDARSFSAIDGGLYTTEMSRRTFARLAELARRVACAGYPVALDATFIRRDSRDAFRALARELGIACIILAFDAPVAVLHARVARRAAVGLDASEANGEVLDSQLADRDPIAADEQPHTIAIDTARAIDWTAVLERVDTLCATDAGVSGCRPPGSAR